jgi:hypothetical protein
MREILWLLAGVAVGVLHGWSVTWSVGSLRPGRKGQARIAVLVGSLLRTAGTAVVLFVAVTQELTWGLLAIVGFVVSRTVYTAIAASRMAHPDGSRNEGG